mmetsp:Transcript_10853/g.22962  ORF Transcript_10853/g.22962 Transcript_10853/m.22962 type:complete len:231 (-) Transcript_10853:42-734(-)
MKSFPSPNEAAVTPKAMRNDSNPEICSSAITSPSPLKLRIFVLHPHRDNNIKTQPSMLVTNNSFQKEAMNIHTSYRSPAILCNTAFKTVSFAVHLTEVREISYRYPKDFFYSREETARFREEARKDLLVESTSSSGQDILDLVLSSVVLMVLTIVTLIFITVACFPLLLVAKIVSGLLYGTSDDHIDSSICTDTPDDHTELIAERLFLGVFNAVEGMLSTKRGYSQLIGN